MPLIFIPENNEYNPLELEPYRSLNMEFDGKKDDIDGAQITISVPNQRRGLIYGFNVDRFYCEGIVVKFMFSYIHKKNDKVDILIHHTIEYAFDPSFVAVQQNMAEELMSRADYIYLPGVNHLELTYRLTSKNIQLIFDAVTEESKDIQTICNQFISHDIAMFSRGW